MSSQTATVADHGLKQGRIFHVPLDVATEPAEGHVYVHRWWKVHPEHGVAFYCVDRGPMRTEEPAPQCNSDRRVVEQRLWDGYEARLIPAVYAAHAVRYQRETRPTAPAPGPNRGPVSRPDRVMVAASIRDCICADPENCTQAVPGYRCKRGLTA